MHRKTSASAVLPVFHTRLTTSGGGVAAAEALADSKRKYSERAVSGRWRRHFHAALRLPCFVEKMPHTSEVLVVGSRAGHRAGMIASVSS